MTLKIFAKSFSHAFSCKNLRAILGGNHEESQGHHLEGTDKESEMGCKGGKHYKEGRTGC